MNQSHSHPVQHPVGLSIILHLFPGLVLLLGFILLGPVFAARELPSLLAIIVVDALIVLPLMIGIVWYAGRRRGADPVRAPAVAYREKPVWPVFTLLVIITLAWAILALVVLSPVSEALRTTVFSWVPEWFDLGHYLVSPESYTSGAMLVTWSLALVVTSVAAPLVEEIYFRGYLLPRIDRFGGWAPLINLVLFAVYHFWSLWLAPARIVALLPLIYVVWLKRSLYIAIVVHVLLNVTGDSILAVPVVFG